MTVALGTVDRAVSSASGTASPEKASSAIPRSVQAVRSASNDESQDRRPPSSRTITARAPSRSGMVPSAKCHGFAPRTDNALCRTSTTYCYRRWLRGHPVQDQGEGTQQFNGGLVTGNTFRFLGVPAAVGLAAEHQEDAKPGAPPVFVMSHKMWVKHFNLDPGIVGRTFVLNNVPTTLVGIMPRRFTKLGADLWKPVVLDRGDAEGRGRFLHVSGAAETRGNLSRWKRTSA